MFKRYFFRNTEETPKVLETAQAWLGYTQQAGGRSVFGERTGHDGRPWNGSFIDVVFFDSGLEIPSCVQTGQGLAEFIRTGRVVNEPRPGDIVFLTTGTDDIFGMPHVGLVADTSRFKTDNVLGTIEACVNTGLPKSDPGVRGVFRRMRNGHEVLVFCRPGASHKKQTGGLEIDLENIRPGRRNKQIGRVQLALRNVTGLVGELPDAFDGSTQQAYAHWQRILGYADRANGIPDQASLRKLGERTGVFKLKA